MNIPKSQLEKKGMRLEGRSFNQLRFADDIVLLAETATDLEVLIKQLNKENAKVGLHMNTSKTKMTNSKQVPITFKGQSLDYVDQYIYFGKHS